MSRNHFLCSWLPALTVLIVVFGILLVWFLCSARGEIVLVYHAEVPQNWQLRNSKPFQRKVFAKERKTLELRSSSGGALEYRVRTPFSAVNTIELLPPEQPVQLMLREIRVEFLGIRLFEHFPKALLKTARPAGSMLVQGGENNEYIRLIGRGADGLIRFRVTDDLPQVLIFLIPALAALVAAAVVLLLTGAVARKRTGAFFSTIWNAPEQVLCTVFFLLLVLPTVICSLSGDGREHPRAPEFQLRTIHQYPEDVEEWYGKNLPFRDQLMDANYLLWYKHLNISPTRQAITGKDGWIFYNSKVAEENSDSYADYLGTNLFSNLELERIRLNLEALRDFLAEHRIEFVFFIAPGKMSIYGEFLPESRRRASEATLTRARQLSAYLRRKSSLKVVYPEPDLLAAKTNRNVGLYYKTDTHWNHCGAYVGTEVLLRAVDPGYRMTPYSEVKLRTGYFNGDLSFLMNVREPETIAMPDLPVYEGLQDISFVQYRFPSNRGKRLLVLRDSFSIGMMPFLNAYSSQIAYYRKYAFEPGLFLRENPECVVLQVVERHLPELLQLRRENDK